MSEPDDERLESGAAGHRATADLEARIARARGQRSAEADAEQTRQGDMSGLGLAWRLVSEFVAAIVVGGGLGYLADTFLPTRPWGMIVLLLLGFAAGVLAMVRATKELNAAASAGGARAVPDDDDD